MAEQATFKELSTFPYLQDAESPMPMKLDNFWVLNIMPSYFRLRNHNYICKA